MANENDKSDSLEALERKLGGFAAAPARVERDRLMFLAGRASAEGPGGQGTRGSGFGVRGSEGKGAGRRGWLWPAVAGGLGATAAGLAMALVLRGESREVVVYRDVPGPAAVIAVAPRGASAEDFQVAAVVTSRPAVSRVPAENYLRTREVAVRMGLDAIGSQPGGPYFSAPPTYGDLLQGLTGSRRDSERGEERRENLSNM